MKKTFRSVLTFALALAMMVTCVGGTAFAASSDSGSIDGYSWSARVSTTSNSATATTSFGAAVSSITATVKVFYWFGDKNYFTPASGQVTPGYAVATATKQLGGAEVIGGSGYHTIYYNRTYRSADTSIGRTPPDATEK